MSKTIREVVHEGWLIKSPPTKRIWRAVCFCFDIFDSILMVLLFKCVQCLYIGLYV